MTEQTEKTLPLWAQGRSNLLEKDSSTSWRYGDKPDYSKSEERLAQRSNYKHAEGSLAAIVQNLVRVFEMEASFKTDPQEWVSVVKEKFRMSTNGGAWVTADDTVQEGTYNLFLEDTEEYKASEESFESSANVFHGAFPEGFLWEVIDVYSGPPVVTFKWRHFGKFDGQFKGYSPTGEVVEVVGVSVAHVNEELKIEILEHYFDRAGFLQALTSHSKCPFH